MYIPSPASAVLVQGSVPPGFEGRFFSAFPLRPTVMPLHHRFSAWAGCCSHVFSAPLSQPAGKESHPSATPAARRLKSAETAAAGRGDAASKSHRILIPVNRTGTQHILGSPALGDVRLPPSSCLPCSCLSSLVSRAFAKGWRGL